MIAQAVRSQQLDLSLYQGRELFEILALFVVPVLDGGGLSGSFFVWSLLRLHSPSPSGNGVLWQPLERLWYSLFAGLSVTASLSSSFSGSCCGQSSRQLSFGNYWELIYPQTAKQKR